MKELTDTEIKHLLEEEALYVWREFEMPDQERYDLWIPEIDAVCAECGQQRPFQDLRSRGGGTRLPRETLASGVSYLTFTCVSCKREQRRYNVEHIVSDDSIRIRKFGELPERTLHTSAYLHSSAYVSCSWVETTCRFFHSKG